MSRGVALVGCGLIGRKRAAALAPAKLVACADVVLDRAKALAAQHPGATAVERWQDAVTRPDVDVVIVAATNDALATVAMCASASITAIIPPCSKRAPSSIPVCLDGSCSCGGGTDTGGASAMRRSGDRTRRFQAAASSSTRAYI